MEALLKDLRAYKIIFQFLEDRYFRGPSNELGELLSSFSFDARRQPADAAMPQDGERAVEPVDARDHADFGQGLKLSRQERKGRDLSRPPLFRN